jgi:hypothetical protein
MTDSTQKDAGKNIFIGIISAAAGCLIIFLLIKFLG